MQYRAVLPKLENGLSFLIGRFGRFQDDAIPFGPFPGSVQGQFPLGVTEVLVEILVVTVQDLQPVAFTVEDRETRTPKLLDTQQEGEFFSRPDMNLQSLEARMKSNNPGKVDSDGQSLTQPPPEESNDRMCHRSPMKRQLSSSKSMEC
jgi:hypothetical protein